MKEKQERAAAAGREAEIEAGWATDQVEQAWSLLRPLFPSMHDFLCELLLHIILFDHLKCQIYLPFRGMTSWIHMWPTSFCCKWLGYEHSKEACVVRVRLSVPAFQACPGDSSLWDLTQALLAKGSCWCWDSCTHTLPNTQTGWWNAIHIARSAILQTPRSCKFNTSLLPSFSKHIHQVLTTMLGMLAKAWNDHASDFLTTMCMYFLACSTSRSVFDILNHAGVTLWYTQAITKIKQLRRECLTHQENWDLEILINFLPISKKTRNFKKSWK